MAKQRHSPRHQQPVDDSGRPHAVSIWKRRYEIMARPCHTTEPTYIDIDVTPSMSFHIRDTGDKELALATRKGVMGAYDEDPDSYVSSRISGMILYQSHHAWIVHAWRAAQAARLLKELGLGDDGVDGLDFCRPTYVNQGRLGRIRRTLLPDRRRTIAEVLEERLDHEVARRLELIEITSPRQFVIDIGNGVTIDAGRFEPILGVFHPDHGTLTLPGRAAETLNARMDAMRIHAHRSLVEGPGRESARIGRMLELCREAIAADPDMTDAAGTRLGPLAQDYLPGLEVKHRRAMESSSPDEREAIDREVAEALEGVADALEQGWSMRARRDRDALRVDLGFIRMRHPSDDRGKS